MAAAVEPTLNLNNFEIQLLGLQLGIWGTRLQVWVWSSQQRPGVSGTMRHLQNCVVSVCVCVCVCAHTCVCTWGQSALAGADGRAPRIWKVSGLMPKPRARVS